MPGSQLYRLSIHKRALANWHTLQPKTRACLQSEVSQGLGVGTNQVWMFIAQSLACTNTQQPEASVVFRSYFVGNSLLKASVVCAVAHNNPEMRLSLMTLRYLHLGMAKRVKWGGVWLKPPLCFGLMVDEQYGSSAAAVFLDMHDGAVRQRKPPFYSELMGMFRQHAGGVRSWWAEFGFGGCRDEVVKLARALPFHHSPFSVLAEAPVVQVPMILCLPKMLRIFRV